MVTRKRVVSFLLHDSDSELCDSECESCEDPGSLYDSDSESWDFDSKPCEEDPDALAFPDHWIASLDAGEA